MNSSPTRQRKSFCILSKLESKDLAVPGKYANNTSYLVVSDSMPCGVKYFLERCKEPTVSLTLECISEFHLMSEMIMNLSKSSKEGPLFSYWICTHTGLNGNCIDEDI